MRAHNVTVAGATLGIAVTLGCLLNGLADNTLLYTTTGYAAALVIGAVLGQGVGTHSLSKEAPSPFAPPAILMTRLASQSLTPSSAQTRPRSEERRLAVVWWSGGGNVALSPRGQRTQHLVAALARYAAVEQVGADSIPQWVAGDDTRRTSSRYRRIARKLLESVLIDKYEISARRNLHTWRPTVDGAVLVGFPWSPLPIAARKLSEMRVPYVVDVGDPWTLTNAARADFAVRSRAARAERFVWESARGAMVTTTGQAQALQRLFPHLRTLVRPNGYEPTPSATVRIQSDDRNPRELRLVHYGTVHGSRADFRRVLERLARSGRWAHITLRQYGSDWEGALGAPIAGVTVDHRSPLPWEDILAAASEFDAALVLGWSNPAQLPSKTVQYLTLPIPRIAITSPHESDALASYLVDKPGWLTLNVNTEDAPDLVETHVTTRWTREQLAPPVGESWACVSEQLARFVADTLQVHSSEQ